jgi:sodium/potassium-transporting ATPase subunit alpha
MMDKDVKGKAKDISKDAVANDKVRTMDYHKLEIKTLEERLKTRIMGDESGHGRNFGLTEDEAAQILHSYGPNALKEKRGTPWYVKLLKEMTGPFALMIWVSSLLCLIAYLIDTNDPSNLYLSIVLALVVLITSIFSYSQ